MIIFLWYKSCKSPDWPLCWQVTRILLKSNKNTELLLKWTDGQMGEWGGESRIFYLQCMLIFFFFFYLKCMDWFSTRFISASISRWMTYDPAKLPILPGGKCCALAPLNKFPKEKHQFLSDLSLKSSISMCSIFMITKRYKVFLWKLCQSKNGICDESPPKRWTVAETFTWRLLIFMKFSEYVM